MKKSKFTLEVENKLIKAVPKKFSGKFKAEFYIKGKGSEACRLKFLNLTTPQIKLLLAALFSTKAESSAQELFASIQNLWFESDIFEAKTLALCWLDRQKFDFLLKNHKKILSWATEIDNWAHADGLCSIYARLFDRSPKLILPTYLKWNQHKNSWFRRCSMVGVFYYSRLRINQPSFALATKLVSPHLAAPEHYVQKAVGWTIREMYNVYSVETAQYIEERLQLISSVAWVAASEKLPVKTKKRLLKKRRAFL